MKQVRFSSLFIVCSLAFGLSLTACKDKAKDTTNTTTNSNVDSNNANVTPPMVSSDAALEQGVKDATKDYPGVTATVSNGEINLSGSIERERWIKLKQSLDALSPKKVNADQLTIK